MDNILKGTIVEELSQEEQKEFKGCLLLIQDSYIRMAGNTDPQYRAKQRAFCDKSLHRMTEILSRSGNGGKDNGK